MNQSAVEAHQHAVAALWRAIDARWGLWDADEVTRHTGSPPPADAVAVTRPDGVRYPGFQFASDGTVSPEWGHVAAILTAAGWSADDIVLWAASPTGWLNGRVPVDVLASDPAAVAAAARTVAEGTAV